MGYLAQELRRTNGGGKARIATGVPAGSDIEHADEVTMTRAMEGRGVLGGFWLTFARFTLLLFTFYAK